MKRMIALVTMIGLSAGPILADDLLFRLSGDDAINAQEQKNIELVDGTYGKAIRFGKGSLVRFPSKGNLNRSTGTVCMWVRPNWDAEEQSSHALFSDDREFKTGNNSLTLWEWHTGNMRFDVRDDKDNYLVHSVTPWRKGEWHHVAAAWDCEVGSWLFVDGDMVATKRFTWEPKESESFQFGAARGGTWPTDADLDDIRIYDGALSVGQVQRVMGGRELARIRYLDLKLPAEATVGEEFEAELQFEAPKQMDDDYVVTLLLDDIQVASKPLLGEDKNGKVALRAVIPSYLYPAPGKHLLTVKIAGAFEVDGEKARREVSLRLHEEKKPGGWWGSERIAALPKDCGVYVGGEFLDAKEFSARQKELIDNGRIVDAVPCRLIDEVDCSKTDHGYWENSPATVEPLSQGMRFRCVGLQESVTQKLKYHDREQPALAAFAYRVKVMPRPTPHLVVIESINDAERYLEVAIDHPRESKPAPHLASCGTGDRVAIHLSVTYSGREYQTDGKTFRQAFLIFPKTDAVDVMISGTKRGNFPDASPAAASRIWVYEVAAPLDGLRNPLSLPSAERRRSVSIFFPEASLPFEKYGFANTGPEMRASTLRLFIDYMKFMGMSRFELRPFQLSSKAYFKGGRFEMASDLDFFGEALPLMQEAGIDVVPRVMYLHCYHKLLEDDEQNFQWGASGKVLGFGKEGPLPDPLRPAVEKVVLDSIEAMIEACKGYRNVPEVGFDTSIGGLYGWEFSTPTSCTGYSQSDVEQFARDTGTKVADGLDSPGKRHEWLKASCWDKWIEWRCRMWHAFVARIRDVAKAAGKKLELSVRIMPREEFWTQGTPIDEIYRCTAYNPDLFRNESDIHMDYFIRINSDRYFGRWWWKPWFYEPHQPDLFVSKEPRHIELYFNYWEIPMHPWGFRVGPGSPVGRNFFEPLTYAMRTMNPYDVTFFNWFGASIGREFEIREFCRAFRALPAVAPHDFDGEIQAEPMDERLWVKWFDDRLCIVNDAGYERTVTLKIPAAHVAKAAKVYDLPSSQVIAEATGGEACSIRITLRPFDLRTLVFGSLAEKGN